MKFSIQPPPGQSAFEQWRDAMKAVCRLPLGIPTEFRKKVWLSLADHYLFQLKINWEKTVRFVFNERSNPDDDKLGMQIVKDLHRTGCSNFSGEENDEDRAVLKRLLLAYARWNKRVGYCQGFNVIAALLLNVMDRKEDDALKVMIYLIDSVLPESYFANNLRALSVDMAVFRDLLRYTYPRLSKHLDRLQLAAQDIRTGACYEPPLTNVFTMQWFLTLFATCLPVEIVLRVWDSILLEGSEILLRTALTIWGKLAKRIMGASSADEFYSLMGELSSSIMQGSLFDGDTMVKSVYSFGDFPFPHLHELREKYTYNIRPFTPASAAGGGGGAKKSSGPRGAFKSLFNSDDDELDDDDIAAMACMPGEMSNSASDISVLGPGVYGPGGEEASSKASPQLERMNTDIHSLKLQYQRLKQRQQQAHIIIAAASAKKSRAAGSHRLGPPGAPGPVLVPNIESPTAMNHLFVGKASSSARNRLVTDGPRISAPMVSQHNQGLLAKQLQAVANAKAVSKSKRMRTGISSHSAAPNPRAGSPSDWSDGQEIPSSPTRDGRLDSCAEADDVEVSLAHSSSCETVTEQPRERKTTESSSTLSNSPKSSDLISLASDASFAPAADFTQEKSAVVTSSGDFSEPVCEKIVKKSLTNQTSDPVHPKPVYTSDDSCSTQIRSAHVSEASESHASTLSGSDSESPVFASEGEALESSIQVLVTEKTGAAVIGDDADNFLGDTLEHKSMTASLDAVRDDSGVDSPSSNSPMLSPGKRLGDTPHLTDSTAHVSSREVDIILAVERRTSTQNVIGSCEQISLSEVEDIRVSLVRPETENAAVRIPCGTDDQLCLSGDHGEESSLAAVLSVEVQDVKSNTCSDYRSTDSVAIDGLDSRSSSVSAVDFSDRSGTSIATDSGSKVKVDRQVSSSSTDSAVEVARLLDATAVTSPPRAVRSASVVETVPVPETVDVGTTERTSAAPDATRHKAMTNSRRDKDSHQGYSKPRRSSQPVVRRVGHQTMVVAHKPSMESSDGQRLSPSSGMDREGERSPGSSTTFPTLLKKSQRPFNPFPVKHFNANRAKTGLKLGLYSASTIDQLRGLKTRTTSS